MKKFPVKSAAIILITVTAASLAVFSYQLFADTSKKIQDISERETRSNAEIQVHDLSNSLSNALTDVTNNLQFLSDAPAVQAMEIERARQLIDSSASADENLVDFYMWLDRDGRVVWISNLNQTEYEMYKGLDLSFRLYYEIPKQNHKTYYSSVTESNDNINRLFISHPILDRVPFVSDSDFKGVVVAGIRADVMGDFLQKQLSPKIEGQVTSLDKTGIILYSKDEQHIGKNVFGVRYQSSLSSLDPSALRALNEGLKAALSGEAGSRDFPVRGNTATVAFQPVMIGPEQFGTLYMIAPHANANDVAALIDQQTYTSIFLVLVIGAAAAGMISIIFTWNNRLKELVEARTAQLKAAFEQVEKHNIMQHEFINVAAHEIRTPVQPILGIASMIEANSDGKKRIEIEKEDLDIILRNSRRLERLTSDLLQVARIEGNTMQLNKERFDLNEKIEHVVGELARTALANREEPKIDFMPSKERPLVVNADQSKIFEVISNLLRNSIKFTKGGTITISCESDEAHHNAVVRVKDTGQGIDPEILPKLFTKFTSKSDSGTGLGLFISKSIIQAHGGTIRAQNNTDSGATFEFTLPLSNGQKP